MNLQKCAQYFYLLAVLLTVTALFFVLSPPRIGTHGDSKADGLSTEIRHLTLLDYFLNTRAAEDVPYAAVGTSPYASYYARTGAFEVFILAAGMCVIGRIVQPSTSRKK